MFSALSLLAQSTYSTDYTTYTTTANPDASAAVGAIVLLTFLFYVPLFIIAILGIVGMWKVFVKAGKPGWVAIVPVYNGMVMAEIAGKPNWWGLGYLISPLNIVVSILFGIDIAKRFGRSETFGVVGLGLFSVVGLLMVGFGKDKYDPTATPTHQ